MSSEKRDFILYLEDMLLSMERIEEYIGSLDFEAFKTNYLVVDAVVRNLEIIGEASKNVPESLKEECPEVPWGKMYGLRNLIAHEYFGVDYEMIWQIAKNNLPENKIDIEKILKTEKLKGGNKELR